VKAGELVKLGPSAASGGKGERLVGAVVVKWRDDAAREKMVTGWKPVLRLSPFDCENY